jgi:2-phospho-L-lactate guanylyltransferase
MSLWAIVPVKPLRRGKSRLSDVLTEDERAELSKRMLIATVYTLKQVKNIEHILVVSRDPAALAVARASGARTLLENGNPELNIGLTRAAMVATAYKAHGVIVMPADLPMLDSQDVSEMIEMSKPGPCVVISPDRRNEGTNALLLTPPDIIAFDYGVGSFERHCERARIAEAHLEIFEAESLALDLDLPEDLALIGMSLNMDFSSEKAG